MRGRCHRRWGGCVTLGPVDKLIGPEACGGDVYEAEIACRCFVVSGCETARAFELGEAPFDAVSQRVGDGVVGYWLFAVGLGRDHRRSATQCNGFADMIAVIAPVGQEYARGWQIIIDQRIEALEVGDLAAGCFRPDREAVSVGNEVNFGREATF